VLSKQQIIPKGLISEELALWARLLGWHCHTGNGKHSASYKLIYKHKGFPI
jgi:hypothetical protein